MILDVKSPITTHLIYDHRLNKAIPVRIKWDGRDYLVTKVGMHYTYRNGKTLFHVFTVTSNELSFKLVLNTDNLFWSVEQVSDGQPD